MEGGGSVKISFGPLVRSEKAEDEGAAGSFLLRIDLPASRPLVWTALLLYGLVEADGSAERGGLVSQRLENNQGQGAPFGLWLREERDDGSGWSVQLKGEGVSLAGERQQWGCPVEDSGGGFGAVLWVCEEKRP